MMRILLLLFVVTGCATTAKLPEKRTDRLSILQGITNSRSVEFSVVAPKEKLLRFELRTAEGEIISPEEARTDIRDFSPYAVHKVIFPRDPAKEYNLYAFESDKVVDQRLVGKGQRERSRLKLAVASCMDDYMQDEFPIWDALAARNPEYLLLIGDNVYADKTGENSTLTATPEQLWKRYMDVRLSLPLYFQEKLVPVHALWDDHDYGANNTGATYEHKEASREVFQTFFAQDLSGDDWEEGQGVGGVLTLGDFNLYFLDARTFRSPEKSGSHLGEEQESWLLKKLAEETAPSFLVKGDQFFGGYHQFESFEGNHPDNFSSFTTALKKLETPVVFMSGDRHMSELMQFPRSLFRKPSFEITSSPIHAKMFPDGQDSNPWRVVANKAHSNFTMVTSEARDNHWFMDVENVGKNGETLFKRDIAVFIKDLQNNLNEVRKIRKGKRRYQKGYRKQRGRGRRR